MIRDKYPVYSKNGRFKAYDDDASEMEIWVCELLNQFERLNGNLDSINSKQDMMLVSIKRIADALDGGLLVSNDTTNVEEITCAIDELKSATEDISLEIMRLRK